MCFKNGPPPKGQDESCEYRKYITRVEKGHIPAIQIGNMPVFSKGLDDGKGEGVSVERTVSVSTFMC